MRFMETDPSGQVIAREYWDSRLAFWRSFAGALGLHAIAVLIVDVGASGDSLRYVIGAVFFGSCLFVAWAAVFPRAAALVTTILVAFAGFSGPLVALLTRDGWLFGACLFDLVAFFLAKRAWTVAQPYKVARRRARRRRKDVRISAGGGM